MYNYAKLKNDFMCVSTLQPFYRGVPFRLSSENSFLVCACNDEGKVVDVAIGFVKNTLEGDTKLIVTLKLTHDENSLLLTSCSARIKFWDLSSATHKRT